MSWAPALCLGRAWPDCVVPSILWFSVSLCVSRRFGLQLWHSTFPHGNWDSGSLRDGWLFPNNGEKNSSRWGGKVILVFASILWETFGKIISSFWPQFLYGKVRGLQDNLTFSGLGSGISEKLLESFPTSLREIAISPTAVAIAAHLQTGRGSFLFSLWILCLHIEG